MPNILVRDVPEAVLESLSAKAGPRGREGYVRDLMQREADRLSYEGGFLLACRTDLGSEAVDGLVGEGVLRPFQKGCEGRRMTDRTWQGVPETLGRAVRSMSLCAPGGAGLPSLSVLMALEVKARSLINSESRCPVPLRTEGYDLGLVPLGLPQAAGSWACSAALAWRAYMHAVGHALDGVERERVEALARLANWAAMRRRTRLAAGRLLALGDALGKEGAVTLSRPSLCIRAREVRPGLHHSERSVVLVDHEGFEHGIQVSDRSVMGCHLVIDEADALPPGDLVQVRLPRETDGGCWGLTFPMEAASIRRVPLVEGARGSEVAVHDLLEELRQHYDFLRNHLRQEADAGSTPADLLLRILETMTSGGLPRGQGPLVGAVGKVVLEGMDREEAEGCG